MRHHLPLAFAILVYASAMACSRSSPVAAPEFTTTATVKDIMDSIVDPGADGIWDAVEIVATLEGVTEKMPKTDDEWKALRRHAIAVIETGNLLIIPGRHIAQPGEQAVDGRVDLQPEEIEGLVNQDRAAWAKLARGLHDAGVQNLDAIQSRNVKQLIDAGEALDNACESCHKKYWYRNDPSGALSPPSALR